MSLFTNENIFREPGVMMKSASARDYCNALFSIENLIALQLLKGILCTGMDGFAPKCNNVVLFSPIGWVEHLPAFGSGAD